MNSANHGSIERKRQIRRVTRAMNEYRSGYLRDAGNLSPEELVAAMGLEPIIKVPDPIKEIMAHPLPKTANKILNLMPFRHS